VRELARWARGEGLGLGVVRAGARGHIDGAERRRDGRWRGGRVDDAVAHVGRAIDAVARDGALDVGPVDLRLIQVLQVADDVGVVLGGHRRARDANLQARARGRAQRVVGVEEADALAVGKVAALGLVGRSRARDGGVGARRGQAVPNAAVGRERRRRRRRRGSRLVAHADELWAKSSRAEATQAVHGSVDKPPLKGGSFARATDGVRTVAVEAYAARSGWVASHVDCRVLVRYDLFLGGVAFLERRD